MALKNKGLRRGAKVVLDEKVAYDSVQFVYQKGIAYGYQMGLRHLVWIDGFYDMVGIQQMTKYGRLSGVTLGPVDVVRFAEAFGTRGLKIEGPEEISSTLKKALAMQGPVVGVPVDYRDNHRLMENVHPDALD